MSESPNTSCADGIQTRLKARLPEIEQTCLKEIHTISDPGAVADPSYRDGLRLAVSTALDYGLVAVDKPAVASEAPVPLPLLAQARAAAHAGVSLDIVLRRCSAGSALLRDSLIEEAVRTSLDPSALNRLLRSQAAIFDRLLNDVGEEYRQALEVDLEPAQRYANRIQRLVAGESTDTSDIPYDFNVHHLGLIIAGPTNAEDIRRLALALDRRLLIISHAEDTHWAWLGGRRPLDAQALHSLASSRDWRPGVTITCGESSFGLAGWRLTHLQARAAWPLAKRDPSPVTSYADVAVLSTITRDDLLMTSLRQLYVAPLKPDTARGQTLCNTLRAYFAAEGNVSSAAAALKVKRHTVTLRLRVIEEHIGHPLSGHAHAIAIALKLDELPSVTEDFSPIATDRSRQLP